jgi:hypothetical protein
MKVCPECGCDEFYADHHAVVRRTYQVSDEGYVGGHIEEAIHDIDRDVDAFTCDGCGDTVTEDDLVTVDVYNGEDDE